MKTGAARWRFLTGGFTGTALAVIGATTFSGKAIIVKLGYRYGADAVTLLMLRMLFALPLFLAMAWWAGRGKPALTLRDGLAILGLGLTGFYLASLLDFVGLQYIAASLERQILCLQPTLVLLFGFFLFKRQVSGHQIVGIAISYAGVLVVFGHEALLAQHQSTIRGTALVLAGIFVFTRAATRQSAAAPVQTLPLADHPESNGGR